MTDKADDVKVQLFALVPSEMFVGRAWLSETAKDALHLINTQAAEIAALKEIVKNDGDVLIRAGVLFDKDRIITAQAAEIERLREALTIIVHQSTDLPSAIVTASRALVGE